MSKEIYPFPKDLETREVKRKNASSERLKRMTDAEERLWEQEAALRAMRYLVGERLKPSFLMIKGNVERQSRECDDKFMDLLKTNDNGAEDTESK